ncbi:MAG: ATP-binding protein [Schwartzia sp.]|nr:ATP-binding protein [Schwartzia sp. (in: firmicutes)]
MERHLLHELKRWKDSPHRKPLILKGARQVGKTWLMREFGKRYYQKVAYVNFDNNPRMQQVFTEDFSIDRLLLAINAETGVAITPEDTLIIFDEIQEAPKAIASLKYFCEEAASYHIVAAGSLLGVAIHGGDSFPVGKVNTLRVYPMTFVEFLYAVGEDGLATLLEQGDWKLIDTFQDKFTAWLKNYYYVGGMPEAVKIFAETRDYQSVRRMQSELTEMYEADFGKHVDARELPRVRMVWNAIPVQLAKENKKFFFGQVKKGARARDWETAIEWLLDCGLITRVHRVTKPAVPLKAYQEMNAYKLFFLDVGLLGAISGIDARSLLEGNRLFVEFKGALTEQYVCQQLIADKGYEPFYFSSESNKYEIDFMLQNGHDVIPVEVKAEHNVRAKSLRAYVEKHKPAKAVRLSMNNYRQEEWLINIPLFAIHCLDFDRI